MKTSRWDNAEGRAQAAEGPSVALVEHGANRPEAVAQRRLADLAHQAPQAQSTARYQSLFDRSPAVTALAQQQETAHDGAVNGQRPLQAVSGPPMQLGRRGKNGGGYRPSKNDMKRQRQHAKFQQKNAQKHQQYIEAEARRPPRFQGGGGSSGNPLLALLLLMMVGGAYGANLYNTTSSGQNFGPNGTHGGSGGRSGGSPDNSRALTVYQEPSFSGGSYGNTTALPLTSMFSPYGFTPWSFGNTTAPSEVSTLGSPQLLLPSPSGNATAPSESNEPSSPLFEGLDTLRVGFQHSGGYGHLDAGVSLMQEIGSLGFRGLLHMIFQNFTGSEGVPTAAKLGQLLPGFDPHGKNQTFSFGGRDVLATEQELFMSSTSPRERVPLGLVGASDATDDTKWLDALNVDEALMLQPYQWVMDEEERFLLGRDESGGPKHESLGLPITSTYQYPIPDPWEETSGDISEKYKALEAFGQRSMLGKPSQVQSKLPGLLQILNATRSGTAELMPIYGLHYFSKLGETAKSKPRVDNTLINLAGGARGFQGMKRDPRPVIMTILSNIPGDVPDLGPDTLSTDVSAPDFGDTLHGLRPRDILAVTAGSIPRELFQLLYKSATLPGTFEGANTANLVQVLGKPFLSVFQGMTEIPEGNPKVKPQYERVKQVSNKLKDKQPRQWEKQLGQFFLDTQDPSSDLSRYYQVVHDEATSPENRQVLRALELHKERRGQKDKDDDTE